jgi:hypothetical protein
VPLTRDELKAIAVDALERLKKMSWNRFEDSFGDPKLTYIHTYCNPITRTIQKLSFL